MAFCIAMVATGSRAQDDGPCQQQGGGYGGVSCPPTNSPAPKTTALKPTPSISLTIGRGQLAPPKPAPSGSLASDRAIPAAPGPAKPARPMTAPTVGHYGVAPRKPTRTAAQQPRRVRRSVARGTMRDRQYAQGFYGYRSPSRREYDRSWTMQGMPSGGPYPPKVYDYYFPLPNNYRAAPPTYGYEGRYGYVQGYAVPYYGGYPYPTGLETAIEIGATAGAGRPDMPPAVHRAKPRTPAPHQPQRP
jgi:hypothetical protein